MKRCPYCAEEIQDGAIRCPFCRSDLTSPLQTQSLYGRSATRGPDLLAAILAFAGATLMVIGTLIPYTKTQGIDRTLVEFTWPAAAWIGSAVAWWGGPLAMVIAGILLLTLTGSRSLLAGLLIGVAITMWLSFLQVLLVNMGFDTTNRAGTVVGLVGGGLALVSGLAAFAGARSVAQGQGLPAPPR